MIDKVETKIIGGLLVKNESDRWLVEMLNIFSKLCDEIIILDDNSIDNTVEICAEFTKWVYLSSESYWSTREWMQRECLFELCLNFGNLNDWIIILDADELLNNPVGLRDFLKNCTNDSNGFALKLFDMWSKTHYRNDKYWTAHTRYWQMATRKSTNSITWNKSQLHCGRLPIECANDKVIINDSFYIKHMGWSTEQDRLNKYERYMKVDGDGKFGWLDQYKSILHENPNLTKLEVENG